jgi:hypothetical protein
MAAVVVALLMAQGVFPLLDLSVLFGRELLVFIQTPIQETYDGTFYTDP